MYKWPLIVDLLLKNVIFHSYNLVDGIPTPLKNMKVQWEYYSQLHGKNNVPNHQPVMENSIKQCPILGNLHEQLGDVD